MIIKIIKCKKLTIKTQFKKHFLLYKMNLLKKIKRNKMRIIKRKLRIWKIFINNNLKKQKSKNIKKKLVFIYIIIIIKILQYLRYS